MLNTLRIRLKKKSRKYPVKRDEYGRSARQRAFDAFDHGRRPAEVSQMVGISPRTARRYFADWKKLPEKFQSHYIRARAMLKNDTELSDTVIEMLAEHLGTSREEVILRLQKPWGLKQYLMGKWPNYRKERVHTKQEARLRSALQLILFVEQSGMAPKEIAALFSKLISEAQKTRADLNGANCII